MVLSKSVRTLLTLNSRSIREAAIYKVLPACIILADLWQKQPFTAKIMHVGNNFTGGEVGGMVGFIIGICVGAVFGYGFAALVFIGDDDK